MGRLCGVGAQGYRGQLRVTSAPSGCTAVFGLLVWDCKLARLIFRLFNRNGTYWWNIYYVRNIPLDVVHDGHQEQHFLATNALVIQYLEISVDSMVRPPFLRLSILNSSYWPSNAKDEQGLIPLLPSFSSSQYLIFTFLFICVSLKF